MLRFGGLNQCFLKNDSYIDFTEAMGDILAESQAWARNEDVYVARESDVVKSDNSWTISYLNIDLSKNSSVAIPYSILSQVDRINIVGIEDMDQLAKGGYTISFIDVGDNPISLTGGYAGPGSGKINISLNGGTDSNSGNLSNAFKEISGTEQGGQLNLTGMNFVINFPDAKEVEYEYATGHVVAPVGNVNLVGGNSEGGIIAGGNITTAGEAHFFPYNAPGARNVKDDNSSKPDDSKVDDSGDVDDTSKPDDSKVDDSGDVDDTSKPYDSS